MRQRFVFRGKIGERRFVELDLNAPRPPSVAPYVMSDIKEYPSIITGEMITSRSHHRDHLRVHGCIEVGNDMPSAPSPEPLPPEPLPPVHDDIKAALQMSPEKHAEVAAHVRAAEQALPGDLS